MRVERLAILVGIAIFLGSALVTWGALCLLG